MRIGIAKQRLLVFERRKREINAGKESSNARRAVAASLQPRGR